MTAPAYVAEDAVYEADRLAGAVHRMIDDSSYSMRDVSDGLSRLLDTQRHVEGSLAEIGFASIGSLAELKQLRPSALTLANVDEIDDSVHAVIATSTRFGPHAAQASAAQLHTAVDLISGNVRRLTAEGVALWATAPA